MPLPLWLPVAGEENVCARGSSGACVCFASLALSPAPSPIAHTDSPLSLPPYLGPPGLSVSCSPSSWPALGEGQIFTALRLTQDRTGVQKTGVSLQVPKAGGQALSTCRRPGLG